MGLGWPCTFDDRFGWQLPSVQYAGHVHVSGSHQNERIAPQEVEAAYQAHGSRVLRLLRHLLADGEKAQEALQETFLRFAAAASPGSEVKQPAWLFGIARNVVREMRRQSQALDTVSDESELMALGIAAGWAAAIDPEQSAAQHEEQDRFRSALKRLDIASQEVLLLRDVEELSYQEVADILHQTVPSVRSRLHRARLSLMAQLRNDLRNQPHEPMASIPERFVGGIACSAVLNLLSDYIEERLEAAHRQTIEAHLRQCDVCERFGSQYGDTVHQIRKHLV